MTVQASQAKLSKAGRQGTESRPTYQATGRRPASPPGRGHDRRAPRRTSSSLARSSLSGRAYLSVRMPICLPRGSCAAGPALSGATCPPPGRWQGARRALAGRLRRVHPERRVRVALLSRRGSGTPARLSAQTVDRWLRCPCPNSLGPQRDSVCCTVSICVSRGVPSSGALRTRSDGVPRNPRYYKMCYYNI